MEEVEVLKKALRRSLKWMNANNAPQDICDEAQAALLHKAAQQNMHRTGGTHCNFCAGTHGWHEEDCPATDPARR